MHWYSATKRGYVEMIIVTGGAGFIGSNLVKLLNQAVTRIS